MPIPPSPTKNDPVLIASLWTTNFQQPKIYSKHKYSIYASSTLYIFSDNKTYTEVYDTISYKFLVGFLENTCTWNKVHVSITP